MVSKNPSKRPNRLHAEPVDEDLLQRDHDAELHALARSLQNDSGTSINVPFVFIAGTVVALIVLSFIYTWPLWVSLLLIVLFALVCVVTFARRPPVAPLELTSNERDRVERVLAEHGVRPALSLVRALYPGESSAAATRTVKIVSERMAKRTHHKHGD